MRARTDTAPTRAWTPLIAVLATLLGASMLPDAVAAQDLARVDRLGSDGRTADARDSLLAWWETEWDDASRAERERALWLRGVLTLDPVAASGTYRRLVVEYPAGVYSEPALARLGQLSTAVGDTLGAARWFTVLERDYPRSDEAVTASVWLTDNADAVTRAEARGPVPVTPTETPRQNPRDGARGGDRQATQADRDPPPAEQPVDTAATAETGDWTVQLGAFSSEVSARRIADEVRAAGFDVRLVLVDGSDLWRIRSGRFVEDDDARPLAARMVEAGFQAAVIPGANNEVGGG